MNTYRAPVKAKSFRYLTSTNDVKVQTELATVLIESNRKRIFPGERDLKRKLIKFRNSNTIQLLG